MEREFGEKSFRPSPFEFNTIFTGAFNQEYRSLFTRKLPGQILLAAYYIPMTIRELAIELGVASVYLEDEIAVLEKYGLIIKNVSGKYQTNLVVFTGDFYKEFQKKATLFSISALKDIFVNVRSKVSYVRTLNSFCEQLSDSRLIWGMVWFIMQEGYKNFEQRYPDFQAKAELYAGAVGTNYGTSTNDYDQKYGCNAFAGYAGIDDQYYASAIDFNVLPENNHYFRFGQLAQSVFKDKLYDIIAGKQKPEFIILSEKEESKLSEYFSDEAAMMGDLYDQLFLCACQIMKIHAPKNVDDQVERIVFQTTFFQTTGMVGYYLINGNVLAFPDFDGPAAMYVRENTEEKRASINVNKALK